MAGSITRESILLFGATGYIGEFILDHILETKESFGRIAIFTSPGTAEAKAKRLSGLSAKGVHVIVGDVRNTRDILDAYQGIDTVISAVGRNVIAEQINWIQLAQQAPSVKRFFPSEYGTDIEYGPQSANEIPHQLKLKVRAALKETTGLDYTYVVTGPYADAQIPAYLCAMPSDHEIGSFDVLKKRAVLVGDGKGKISLTTPSDVGKLVVKALLHPEASKNKALKVNSFTTTPEEIVAEFERQCGGEKWEVTYTPLDKLRQLEKDAWENKHPMAPIFTLRRIWGEGGTLYDKRDNGLIDAEDMETLSDAVKAAIEVQRVGTPEVAKDRKFL